MRASWRWYTRIEQPEANATCSYCGFIRICSEKPRHFPQGDFLGADGGKERSAVDRQLLARVRITGMILVYRYRVKSLNGLLNKQSRAVNYVWNFCNDTQKHALKWSKKWPTGFDLNVLTTGSSKALGIHSGTINATCEQYAKSRSQHRRPYLRDRKSTRLNS